MTDLYFTDNQILACYAHTGWDTCPASLNLKVLLNTAQKFKCHKEFVHLQSAFGHLTKYLVGHLKAGHVKNLRYPR